MCVLEEGKEGDGLRFGVLFGLSELIRFYRFRDFSDKSNNKSTIFVGTGPIRSLEVRSVMVGKQLSTAVTPGVAVLLRLLLCARKRWYAYDEWERRSLVHLLF